MKRQATLDRDTGLVSISHSLLQASDHAPRASLREIVYSLQVDPELRGRAECLREQPRRLWCDAPLASNDLVDALQRHSDVLRESHLRDTEGFEKLGFQDRSGVCGNAMSWNHDDTFATVARQWSP
jgi:hypothetical protein